MKVLLTLENHLICCADGHFYVREPEDYSAWCELLEVYDEVVVLARVAKNNCECEMKRVDGPSISVHGLPDYVGPWQYLQKLRSLREEVRAAVAECDAYILRVPGLVSRLAWQEITHLSRTYGVEVVCDPWDVMAPGSIRGLLRPLYRRVASKSVKEMCGSAAAALYWSKKTLQARYPPGAATATFASPRIALGEGSPSPELMNERSERNQKRNSEEAGATTLRIGYVGTFARLYKGPDTLLHALSLCQRANLHFKALLVGDGKYRKPMETLARNLSIHHSVVFLGQLGTGGPIADFLDGIDLFVMPSRAEGLGRAFVEAMARGCPCIGSTAGTIPELLAEDDLVPPDDPTALAQKILDVACDSGHMLAMSRRNLVKAKEFQPDLLQEVRCSFYEYLKNSAARRDDASRSRNAKMLLPSGLISDSDNVHAKTAE